jgi:signal peptidase I
LVYRWTPWVFCGFIYPPIVASAIRGNIIEAYGIPRDAMTPTIALGDFILARKKT